MLSPVVVVTAVVVSFCTTMTALILCSLLRASAAFPGTLTSLCLAHNGLRHEAAVHAWRELLGMAGEAGGAAWFPELPLATAARRIQQRTAPKDRDGDSDGQSRRGIWTLEIDVAPAACREPSAAQPACMHG